MTSHRHTPDTGPADAFLDAARACILDVGWRRTTLTEVARRAGVSRMTIYRRWSDMQQLLGDLMTREWTTVVEGVTADQGPGGTDGTGTDGTGTGTAVDRIVGAVLATVRALRENELFVRIVELDPELVLPYLLSRRGRSQDLVLAVTEAAVREGQAAGEVRAGDPTAMARAVVLAAHGYVLSAHTMVDDAVGEDDLDGELATLLAAGLRP